MNTKFVNKFFLSFLTPALVLSGSVMAQEVTNQTELASQLQGGNAVVSITAGIVTVTTPVTTVTMPKELLGSVNGDNEPLSILRATGANRIAQITGSGDLTITNLIIEHADSAGVVSGPGGAIRAGNVTGNITNSIFRNNAVARTGATPTTLGNGSAVWVTSFTGNIVDSLFDKNTAGDMGAFYSQGNFSGSVIGVTFSNNTADNNNGGLPGAAGLVMEGNFIGGVDGGIIDSKFYNNTAKGYGGAAFSVGNQSGVPTFRGDILRSECVGNTAGQGAAVFVKGGLIGNITDSLFRGNESSSSGGAISIASLTGSINGSIFDNNVSTTAFGGAIFVGSGLSGDILDSEFTNNSAGAGGAIVVYGVGGVIKNTKFHNNLSTIGHGGAIYLPEGSLYFENPDFIGNGAATNGGAVVAGNAAQNATITFKTTAGKTALIAGNTSSAGANAVNFNYAGNLSVDNDANSTLDMLGGVTAIMQSSGRVTVTKTGTGLWKLGGPTILSDDDGTGKSTFAVNAGELHLYGAGETTPAGSPVAPTDGTIVMEGTGGSFTIAGGAILSVGGDNVIHADGLVSFGDRAKVKSDSAADTGLVLTSDGLVEIEKNLGINVVRSGSSLSLDTVLTEKTAGDGVVRKTGLGDLNLAKTDSLAGVGLVELDADSLSSSKDQTFAKLNTAAGSSLAMTVLAGKLAGETIADKFVKNGAGTVDIHGKTSIAGVMEVNAGELGVHISMNDPLISADSAKFAAGTTLTVTGYSGNGSLGHTFVIKTAQAIADVDMPTNSTVDDLSTIGYDFLYGGLQRGEDSKSIIVSCGLSWYHDELTLGVYDEAHGDMSAHTGETRVSEGSVGLGAPGGGTGASAAEFVVGANGVLHGNGSIADIGVAPGGRVSPGHSIGQITVTGNAALSAGSYFDVEMNPADQTDSDRMTVTGSADLGGAMVRHVDTGAAGDYPTTGRWTILTAAGGLNGTRFADQVLGNYVFLNETLLYPNDNSVVLQITRNAMALSAFAYTPNETAVSSALASQQAAGTGLYNTVMALPTGTDVANFYDFLSGEMHASLRGVLQNYDAGFGRTMLARVLAGCPIDARLPVWVEIEGYDYTKKGDGNAARAKMYGINSTVGVEKCLAGGWKFGGAFRYGNNDFKVKERSSRADIDSYTLGLYGGRDFTLGHGLLRWSVGASYGYHDVDSKRNIYVPGFSQHLEAGYHAQTAQLVTDTGWRVPIGDNAAIEPFARLGWNSVWTGRIRESGGSAALHARREHQGNLTHTLGLRGSLAIGSRMSINAGAGWAHTYGGVDTRSRFVFQEGGDIFAVDGVSIPRDAAHLNLGINVNLARRLDLGLNYDGFIGKRTQRHGDRVALQYTF